MAARGAGHGVGLRVGRKRLGRACGARHTWLGRWEGVGGMCNRHGGQIGGVNFRVLRSFWPGVRLRMGLVVLNHFVHFLSLDPAQPVLGSQEHELLNKTINRLPSHIAVCKLLQE